MNSKKEIWKAISIDGKKPSVPYMISNQGRFGVLPDKSKKIEIRNFKPTAGYYRYNTRQKGKNKAIFLFKEVAIAFLKKPSTKHKFVIHKDHNYLNDHVDNLKWATTEEHRAHTTLSPNSVLARKRKAIVKSSHSKVLNEKTVVELKRIIWDPKRKLSFKQIAKKFGVSEMQIYRIKSGEFWYHVKVEHEPVHEKYKQNLFNIAYHQKKEEKTKQKTKTSDKKTKPIKKEKKKEKPLKASHKAEKKLKKDKSKKHKKDKSKHHKKHKHNKKK